METATGTKKPRSRVVFIEYRKGRPFSIETTTADDASFGDTYDVEWCKRDKQLYYTNSGSGPSGEFAVSKKGTYWAAKGIVVAAEPGSKRLVRARGKTDFERILAGDWTAVKFAECRCEYCPICDDYLPAEETDALCPHVWYCGESGDWSRPGGRCSWDCGECAECGRETGPEPASLTIAKGYGIAASDLAGVARGILVRCGIKDAAEFAERMGWCGMAEEAAEKALRGEVDKVVSDGRLEQVADRLGLDSDTKAQLIAAFDAARGGRNLRWQST